jgi:hypothetical protein
MKTKTKKTEKFDGKVVLLRCPSQRKGFRGAAWQESCRTLRFYLFGCIKKPKKAISVSGADPDFLETIFGNKKKP